MAKGYTQIDAEVGWHPTNSRTWEIDRVEYGLDPTYDRVLTVTLSTGDNGDTAVVEISGVTSFRVQHEREMGDFWAEMRAEGVQHGTFYTVRESGYLHDFEGGVSACWKRQLHYIISGGDCLEFLAPGWARDFAIRVVKAPT